MNNYLNQKAGRMLWATQNGREKPQRRKDAKEELIKNLPFASLRPRVPVVPLQLHFLLHTK